MQTARKGYVYRHFKGGSYVVIDIIHDRTNDSEIIVYMQLQGDGIVYSRTREDFFDNVLNRIDNTCKQETRFTLARVCRY